MALPGKFWSQIPSPQKRCGGQINRTTTWQPCLLPAVDRTATTLNTYPSEHCHPNMWNHIRCLPFQRDLINSSSTAVSAFPPQQGADTTNCPKELGLCRLYHHSPLIAFPSCESCKCLCKALRFLHCYGNTVLCSYWNIQPTSIKYHDSQIPAKYLSKERFSKANVLLAFNKEKGRLFSLNNLRLLQAMKLLLTFCTQQLFLPLT